MGKRAHILLIEKCAALAAALLDIPYDHRALMSAEQVLSLLHFDHDPITHAHGGPDKHFNLTPLSIMKHRKKTAEIDIPQIAKTKRLAIAHAALKTYLETGVKPPLPGRPKRKIASRPFPKQHRPLRSRGFERRA